MFKKILKIIGIITIALFQISFINSLSVPFNSLNIVLSAIIFISLIDYGSGLYFTIIASLIMELYSVYPFGFLFFIYFLTFASIVWLFSNILTNKSFYSFLVISLLGVLVYNIIFYIFNNLFFLADSSIFFVKLDNYFFCVLGYKIFFNLTFLIILFLFYKTMGKRMRAVFLVK